MPPTAKHKFYRVDSFKIHINFSYETESNDIGLIKLKEPINLNSENVSAIKLPEKELESNKSIAVSVSWGSIGSSKVSARIFNKTYTIVGIDVCMKMEKESLNSTFGLRQLDNSILASQSSMSTNLTSQLICAQALPDNFDHYCLGDAGEPLILKGRTPDSDTLIGIGSVIINKQFSGSRLVAVCETRLSVFTDIHSYKQWLQA